MCLPSLFPSPMNLLRRIASCSILIAAGHAVLSSAGAQTISTTSPFLPRNGSAGPGAVTENSPLELRGILDASSNPLFGLYDPVKRQGGWVHLNETGKDFPATIRSYDAQNDAISVEYQGRVLNLALKTAKIETMQVAAQPPVPRPLNGQAGPVVTSAPATDNSRQMEAVAAEVQRRRLQRQAMQQRQNQPPPSPPPAGQGH